MATFVLHEYLWLVVVGSFAAFAFGYATGSNDVANAFGTSVGAKTLTMKQAVLIAATFEFTGALVLGRVSTSVIAAKIANISYFYKDPEVYAYGMVCALSISAIWNILASYFSMNVSSTHSIIGSIIGFSLVYGGKDAVNWAVKDPSGSTFPPYTGVLPVVLSWFFSPILTSIGAATLFIILRTIVLRQENSHFKAIWVLPVAMWLTTFVNVYFVLTKGAAKKLTETNPKCNTKCNQHKALWIAAACGGGTALITIVVAVPLLYRRMKTRYDTEGVLIGSADAKKDVDTTPEEENTTSGSSTMQRMKSFFARTYKAATYGLNYNIHQIVEEDPIVAKIHAHAEVFDPRAEYAFSWLQVFSACCVSLAHGAGEVGYMAGPLATVWFVVLTGTLSSKVIAPMWIIIISALGLVIGLATYGYKVTQAMGARMAKLSPARGFCAELCTAIVIMVAAQYGLPTSSSQCITGGIIGVGIAEGTGGVNWLFFAKTFAAWAGTVIVVGLFTAGLFAQGVFSPSMTCSSQMAVYEAGIVGTSRSIYKGMNSTLYTYSRQNLTTTNGPNAELTKLTAAQFKSLAKSLAASDAAGAKYVTYKSVGTVRPEKVLTYLAKALALVRANTIVTIGQQNVFPGATVCNDASYSASNATTTTKACPAPALLSRAPVPYNASVYP